MLMVTTTTTTTTNNNNNNNISALGALKQRLSAFTMMQIERI